MDENFTSNTLWDGLLSIHGIRFLREMTLPAGVAHERKMLCSVSEGDMLASSVDFDLSRMSKRRNCAIFELKMTEP